MFRASTLIFLWLSALVPAARSAQEERPADLAPKVLMIFVDGLVPEALATAPAQNLQRLMREGAWSLDARAESTAISGSGWSTFLTGVHWDKHGVPDNAFEHPRYDRWPHIASLLYEEDDERVVATSLCWTPIWEQLVAPIQLEHASNYQDEATLADFFDRDSNDARVAEDMRRWLQIRELELAIAMFGDLDEAGHSDGNLHYDAWDQRYRGVLRQIDGYVGELLDAIRARRTYAEEDWLVLVSSDHAGSMNLGHGRDIPEHRRIPLIVSGLSETSGVARGEIWPPPTPADLVPTALAHLGVVLRPEWELDGRVLGRAASPRPTATLGENLLVDGDAELERGFDGTAGFPDAWVPGWNDPGKLTVVRYGSPGHIPGLADARSASAGSNLFVGGDSEADTWMELALDLAPLRAEIERGVEYELSAWLGGYLDEDDRASLVATFLGEGGAILGRAVLPPVWPVDRARKTGLARREKVGILPRETREVRVRLDMLVASGANDACADDLSLVLRRLSGVPERR
jgi:hypothetical protein